MHPIYSDEREYFSRSMEVLRKQKDFARTNQGLSFH